jgi:hypothetical protein
VSKKVTLCEALTIEFETFGFFTIALGLRIGAGLVTADGELMFPIITIIICAIEGVKDLVENLFRGERGGFGEGFIELRLWRDNIFMGEGKL